MRLAWRQAPAPLDLAWRGMTAELLEASARDPEAVLATLIGPPGPAGAAGPPIDIFNLPLAP